MVVEMLIRRVIDGQVHLSVELVDTYAEKRSKNGQLGNGQCHTRRPVGEADRYGSYKEDRMLDDNLLQGSR